MATSARELLGLARAHANAATSPTAEDAVSAITALTYVGRQLRQLLPPDSSRARGDVREWSAADQLSRACDTATMTWPSYDGRLADLVGAACDLLDARQRQLSTDERWAVAVELSETSRSCAELALRHPPYAAVPALRWVHAAALRVAHCVGRRPAPATTAALDLLVPAPEVADTRDRFATLDAVAELSHALRQDAATGRLPIAAALATAAGAEQASRVCATLGASWSRDSKTVWRQAPTAWRLVHAALIRFHDGRSRSDASLASVQAAERLRQSLTRLPAVHVVVDAEDATTLRRAAGQLPFVARQLEREVMRWADQPVAFARARHLVRREELVEAMLKNAVVRVGPGDLMPVVAGIRAAGRLSSALAEQLDQPTGRRTRSLAIPPSGGRRPDLRLETDARWAERLAARVGEVSSGRSQPRL